MIPADVRVSALEEAIRVAERAWPQAHTYASENADLYRAQDDVRDRIIDALRERIRFVRQAQSEESEVTP